MREEPLALLPELVLVLAAVAALLLGSFLPRARQAPARAVAAAGLLTALVTAAVQAAVTDPRLVFSFTYAVDRPTAAVRVIVCAGTLLVVCLGIDGAAGTRRETELYVLMLLVALGTIVMAGTTDLLVLAVAFLLTSIPSYALVAWARDGKGTEAALKYYLLGALLGAVMLLGVVLLYAAGGGTTYRQVHAGLLHAPHALAAAGVVAVLAGLLFKAGAVPAHFWVPDVAEASPPAVAAFLTTVPKVGALIAMFRLLDQAVPSSVVNWPLLVAVVAAATMTLGNLAAYAQTSVRRLLGWSTVSQVGYLLMAVAAADRSPGAQRSLLLYLTAYAVTNLTAFGVVCALPHARTIDDYRGLGRTHPVLAAALLTALLGLVGIPPTGVFVAKLAVFTAAWDGGFAWLTVLAAVNTVASMFYYLRWLVPAVQPGTDGRAARTGSPRAAPWALAGTVTGAPALVGVGVLAGPVLAWVAGRAMS